MSQHDVCLCFVLFLPANGILPGCSWHKHNWFWHNSYDCSKYVIFPVTKYRNSEFRKSTVLLTSNTILRNDIWISIKRITIYCAFIELRTLHPLERCFKHCLALGLNHNLELIKVLAKLSLFLKGVQFTHTHLIRTVGQLLKQFPH